MERANQTIIRILKKLTDFGRLSWPEYLQKATEAYNISFHRAINTSPFILKYGKSPKIQIDGKELDSREYSKPQVMNMRDEHFKKYQTSIQKGAKEIKSNLEPVDPVLIFNPPLSKKLKEKWYNGYLIIRKIDPDAYIVSKDGKEYRVNKAHVKKDFASQVSNHGEEVSYKYSL